MVLNKAEISFKKLFEEFNELGGGFERHPELDPLIPRNLRKRILLDEIYEKVIESDIVIDVSHKFNSIIGLILTSE
ncbi:unnamed protein product [marine sediment metagenome]|uniref:Uncharacterized protein n=1 Tax=marine sediment metagenome TaxID=412755 RepID=X1DPD0_9ZZZZ